MLDSFDLMCGVIGGILAAERGGRRGAIMRKCVSCLWFVEPARDEYSRALARARAVLYSSSTTLERGHST